MSTVIVAIIINFIVLNWDHYITAEYLAFSNLHWAPIVQYYNIMANHNDEIM